MALERNYTIPLRKELIKVAPYNRSKKAITGITMFVKRHMRQYDLKKIKIDKFLNLKVWEHGIRNPPSKIKVTAIKEDDGIVRVYLFGGKRDEVKVAEKKDEKKVREPLVVNPKETVTDVKAEPVSETAAEEKPAEHKAEPRTKKAAEASEEKPKHKAKKAEEKAE